MFYCFLKAADPTADSKSQVSSAMEELVLPALSSGQLTDTYQFL